MSSQVIQRNLGPCLVCGDTAIGINFGVPTCAPCKAFFRRNASKLGRVEFVCQVDGDCPIIFKYRRICNCCRLAKCFRVGMKKSLILSDAEKQARRDIVQQNREKRAQLAKKNQSLAISRLTQTRSEYLLITDQTLLTNIFGAFKQTHTLPDNSEYPDFPRVEHKYIHTFLNEYAERCKLYIDYCKLIPEFDRLSINDKKYLLQNNLVETHISSNQAHISSNQTHTKYMSKTLISSIQHIYGPVLSVESKEVLERLFAYTYDPIVLKLVLIIQTLSNRINRYCGRNNMMYVYDDPLSVFAGQNVYVELLWRYLLSRLPSEQDTVKFFNKLMLDLLFLQRVSIVLESYICGTENALDQLTPLMQNLWLM